MSALKCEDMNLFTHVKIRINMQIMISYYKNQMICSMSSTWDIKYKKIKKSLLKQKDNLYNSPK